MSYNKTNLLLAGLAGLSAAAVTVLSVGGYLLHRKVLKHRLQELARRQAMNLAFFDLGNGKVTDDGFEDYGFLDDEDGEDYAADSDFEEYDDDYLNSLLSEFNTEGKDI